MSGIIAEAPRTMFIPPSVESGADPLCDELAKLWVDHILKQSTQDKNDVINGYGWAVTGPLEWVYAYLTRKIENASADAFGLVMDRLGQLTNDEWAALIMSRKQRQGVIEKPPLGTRESG